MLEWTADSLGIANGIIAFPVILNVDGCAALIMIDVPENHISFLHCAR